MSCATLVFGILWVKAEYLVTILDFFFLPNHENTPQPLYNTVRYNTVLYIIWFKDGSQKCIDYIEKWS